MQRILELAKVTFQEKAYEKPIIVIWVIKYSYNLV